MIISNKKKATRLKRLFFLMGLAMAVFMLVMFLTDKILAALLTGGAFIVWYLVFIFLDFQSIEYISENRKIIFRYYPAIKFGKKEYSVIEFQWENLHDARIETSFFNFVSDLILVVKTKRGIAEYPAVSLSAVSKSDRKKIGDNLNQILHK